MRKYLVAVNEERHCFCQTVDTGHSSLSFPNHVGPFNAINSSFLSSAHLRAELQRAGICTRKQAFSRPEVLFHI